MLVRADGLCIGQASHAWLSGQFARHWADPFEPWEEVCLAAEQHDVGMAEWDLDPPCDPETGRPVHFIDMELDVHTRLWAAAPAKLVTQSRHASLLVAMHGIALYERRDRAVPDVARTLDALEAHRDAMLASLDESPARARRNQQLLWVWDWMSLACLLDDWAPGSVSLPDGRELSLTPAEPLRFGVAPWPFQAPAPLRLHVDARRHTPGTPFAQSPWETVPVELVAAEG